LDAVVAGKDSYQGSSRVLTQEPLIWVVGKDAEVSFHEALHLVVLPSPCSFRKIATESLEKANRKWEVLFTGTSIGNIQAAVQAGMGLSILPKGAVKEGLRKAPSHLELPDLPMYSLALITDEQRSNDARDVFISYLEAELNNLK
jgi:DNA-binding transcriptional LysR family regulator